MSTTIYVLTGRDPDDGGCVQQYYATRQAARDVVAEMVLEGDLATPVSIETVEVQGVPGVTTAQYVEALDVERARLSAVAGHAEDRLDSLRERICDALGLDYGDSADIDDDARLVAAVEAVVVDRSDPERGRLRQAVEEATTALVDWWGEEGARIAYGPQKPFLAAVKALREYAPAESAPTPEPEPSVSRSVREELNKLAQLPWAIKPDMPHAVQDAQGHYLFAVRVDGAPVAVDYGIARLLVQLVNGSDPSPERRAAEVAVLDAARECGRIRRENLPGIAAATDRLDDAASVLAALDGPS